MVTQIAQRHKSPPRNFQLVEVATILTVIGLCIGVLLAVRAMMEQSQINSQISQIARYDEAISNFYDKFDGLPGDLVQATAQHEGFAYGDGTPGHSDGDGKISSCDPNMQWNLGCETALFWAQLSTSGLIDDNFSADARLSNELLTAGGRMDPYLPKSPAGEGIYVAVWNADAAQSSLGRQLPFGNYYEISRISGMRYGRMQDASTALTPVQAHAIDEKIDDASPFSGRVLVNGESDWPRSAWGSYATPGERNCVSEDHTYNIYEPARAHQKLCHIAVAFTCCKAHEDE